MQILSHNSQCLEAPSQIRILDLKEAIANFMLILIFTLIMHYINEYAGEHSSTMPEYFTNHVLACCASFHVATAHKAPSNTFKFSILAIRQ